MQYETVWQRNRFCVNSGTVMLRRLALVIWRSVAFACQEWLD